MQLNLKRERLMRVETQEDIAKLINVDVRTYNSKENGVFQFKQNDMFAIARHFYKYIVDIFLTTNFMIHKVRRI
ncbi:helix-turn-helix transcriptional regulator [Fundicoccus sp. Sow4_F4]|uniref:helix-turn-helix transcriptional regulator n=1 Tax=Fundicoccus sp. Sow4_F4 TaxID=3438783 RepID=UPI003F8FCEDA